MPSQLHVVMGVAGSGKSRIGSLLASALGVAFVEGDEYHPPENVARMAAGIPLTDADRRDWLLRLAARLHEAAEHHAGLVLSCSALKRAYRDVLRSAGEIRFIFLSGSRELIAERLRTRRGHYMPVSLLDSQFAALEEPAADEHALVCDIRRSPEEIVADLVQKVSR